MTGCEVHQALLLDYLYDLLEADDRAALEVHLRDCPRCEAALARARRHQGQLADAAKLEFPNVSFQAPAVAPRRRDRSRSEGRALAGAWRRWSLAASIALAVGLGTCLLAGAYGLGRHGRQKDLALAETRIQQLAADWDRLAQPIEAKVDELRALTKQRDELVGRMERNQAELTNRFQQEHLFVSLSGPKHVLAGAPNEFLLEIRDAQGRPVDAQVAARLRDAKAEIADVSIAVIPEARGKQRLRLPHDLRLKPDVGLSLAIEVRGAAGQKVELVERLDAAGPALITHLATDKPIYQPGEVISWRSLTLDRFSLRAPELSPEEELRLIYSITNSRGETVWETHGVGLAFDARTKKPILGPDQQPVRGVGAFSFPIPQDFPGGEYFVTVREAANRFPPERRKVLVHRYEKARLRKEVTLARQTLAPGDELVANVQAAAAEEGTPLAGVDIQAKLTIDGKTYDAAGRESANVVTLRTDSQGAGVLRMRLPGEIVRGDATLSIQFHDGGNVETVVRAVPIVLDRIHVEFYPEGGDLVNGLNTRVYFQARTPQGRPAEFAGTLVDGQGREVARLQTFNDPAQPEVGRGQGAFSFTPQTGVKYALKATGPATAEAVYEFPAVKAEGVVLSTPRGVGTHLDPVDVELQATAAGSFLVGLYCRGRLINHDTVTVATGSVGRVQLKPHFAHGGVHRVTAFRVDEAQGHVPVAERLVYRSPGRKLSVEIAADRPRYQPGDRVNLSWTVKDEADRLVPAFAMASVVDKSVLALASEKTYRAMPTHFLLTHELGRPDDLEFADFLLTDHPQAMQALDLLLGTQGWRRFAEQRLPELRAQPSEDEQRLLAALGDGVRTTNNAAFLREAYARDVAPRLEELAATTAREAVALQGRFQQAKTELAGLEQGVAGMLDAIRRQQLDAHRDRHVAAANLAAFHRQWAVWVGWGVGIVLVSCGLGLLLPRVVHALSGVHWRPARALAAVAAVACIGLATMAAFVRQGVPAGTFDESSVQLAQRPSLLPGMLGKWESGLPGTVALRPGGQPVPDDRVDVAVAGNQGKAATARTLVAEPARDRGFPYKPGGAALGPTNERFKEALRDLVERERSGRRDVTPRGKPNETLSPQDRFQPQPVPPEGRPDVPAPAPGDRNWPQPIPVLPHLPPASGPLFDDPPPAPYFVREYAHQHRKAEEGVREDFTETLFWHPLLVMPEGRGTASFDACDANTTFHATVYVHTLDGRVGASTFSFSSSLALHVEPKVPIELTATDRLELPISITNATEEDREVKVEVLANEGRVEGRCERDLHLKARGRGRAIFGVRPSVKRGHVELAVRGQSGDRRDRLVRRIPVVPDGYPWMGSKSDVLEKPLQATIALPEKWIPGTLWLKADVFPSMLADLERGLEALLAEPNGCFEQTSSANYPNVLILDYLRETNQENKSLADRARQLMTRGHEKLLSFECENPEASGARGGYEWFGGKVPGHEALTAYGLMQFRDMARVHAVDQSMLERTRSWLIGRKDGRGGFLQNPKALDSFGRAPEHVTNAYVVWALTEAGEQDEVARELAALQAHAAGSMDPYFLALVANGLVNLQRHAAAKPLLARLAAAQSKEGHLPGAATSITCSAGRDLHVETTALALLAWLKANDPEWQPNVQRGVQWLSRQRNGRGGFGATQATVLALKALLAHARANRKSTEAGELRLIVNQQTAAHLHFPSGEQNALTLAVEAAERHLVPGRNEVRVEITGNNALPCTLSWSCQTTTPVSAQDCPMRLRTRLDRTAADEGDTVRLTATVGNVSGRGQGMTIAVLGLPAGLSLPEDVQQLRDHVRQGRVSAWETRGREVVLYWRDFAPNAEVEISLDLTCRVPGEYTGTASRTYLYYDAESKYWAEPLAINVRAR